MNYSLLPYLFIVAISPFIGFISVLIFPYIYRITPKIFVFSGALIPSLMLMHKIPSGDLVRYLEWNTYAAEMGILDFFQFMHWREVSYLFLTYFISNIPIYGKSIYIFLVVFISYYLILYSMYLICRYLKVNINLVVIFFLSVILFGPMLALSTQIIRQFLAASFLMLFFALSVSSGKDKWSLVVISVLFHYSALFFIPIIVLAKYTFKIIFLWTGLAVISFYGMFEVLLNIPYIGNIIIKRIATLEGHELNALTSATYVVIFSLIISAVFVMFRSSNQMIIRLCLVSIALSLLIIFTSFFSIATEISVRFFFYTYFFFIFLIPFVIDKFKNKYLLYFMVLFVSILSFVNSVIFGVWEYETLLVPFFSILML